MLPENVSKYCVTLFRISTTSFPYSKLQLLNMLLKAIFIRKHDDTYIVIGMFYQCYSTFYVYPGKVLTQLTKHHLKLFKCIRVWKAYYFGFTRMLKSYSQR